MVAGELGGVVLLTILPTQDWPEVTLKPLVLLSQPGITVGVGDVGAGDGKPPPPPEEPDANPPPPDEVETAPFGHTTEAVFGVMTIGPATPVMVTEFVLPLQD